MNVSFVRLKGVVRELAGIRTELSRLADCWEMELSQTGINMRPPKADKSGPEPTVSYVDEEMDWAREQIAFIDREQKRQQEEAERES